MVAVKIAVMIFMSESVSHLGGSAKFKFPQGFVAKHCFSYLNIVDVLPLQNYPPSTNLARFPDRYSGHLLAKKHA